MEWCVIYIEASEETAKRVFAAKFDRQADNVSCYCCGSDYSVTESESLIEATAYDRNDYERSYGKVILIEDYVTSPGVKFVYKEEILPEEEVHPLVREVFHEEYY